MENATSNQFWIFKKPFSVIAGAALLLNFFWILVEGKAGSFLQINALVSEPVWQFFRFYTMLGEGWSLLVVCVALVFVKYRYALAGLISFAVGSALSSILKHTLFSGMLRPLAYFGELDMAIQTFSGVELHHYNTFPSGHSITVFSMFSLLAIITKSQWGYLWAILAILGIFSRVAICLHFVPDITAGALIGWLSTWFAWSMAVSFKKPALDGRLSI
jgi:membrane-associated phospholipid phosphatase